MADEYVYKILPRSDPGQARVKATINWHIMKWRRISRATKLLSRIFKISKILKKCPFFSFRNSFPQINIFNKKTY